MEVSKGLIIDTPHIDRILAGIKSWEMRSTATQLRGRIGLIRKGSGLVVGTVELVDCKGPLSREERVLNQACHQIEKERVLSGEVDKWPFAWVLRVPQKLARPIPYRHPSGAVIWVNLEREVTQSLSDA